jgi:hypothetical protein
LATKPKKKTKTTALARRPSHAPAHRPRHVPARRPKAELVGAQPGGGKTAAAREALERLTDEPLVLAIGKLLKFSKTEEKILSEAVSDDDVLIKPTGQPYLSHPNYTRWFNRAFGRGQWELKQLQKPQKQAGSSIVVLYALIIHGVPMYSAYGAAEYHENNRDQNFDDVLEATHAYALRRFAKRLGVGLELWDRRWLNRWTRKYAIRVWLKPRKPGDDKKMVWRRRDDPPFWNEIPVKGQQQRETAGDELPPQVVGEDPSDWSPPPAREHRKPDTTEPAHVHNPHADSPITPDQVTRFWTIAGRHKRGNAEVHVWLSAKYNISSLKDLKRLDYDDAVNALEAPGPLKLDPAREPGQEG